jgi:hypothetical protein
MFQSQIAKWAKLPLGISIALLVSASLGGCKTTDSSMESAIKANLASETALNAQIMADRAREQRCKRNPDRKECGPR